jgi:hypothetical protein
VERVLNHHNNNNDSTAIQISKPAFLPQNCFSRVLESKRRKLHSEGNTEPRQTFSGGFTNTFLRTLCEFFIATGECNLI